MLRSALCRVRFAEAAGRRLLSSSSSQSNPRQGHLRFSTPQRENPKLRSHAVSIFHSDYSDDGTEDPFDDDEEETSGVDEEEDWFQKKSDIASLFQKKQEEDQSQRQKWLQNSKPPKRVPIIDERGRSYGRGGRKTASARVWIEPGFGQVVVNRMPLIDYFPRESDRDHLLQPLVATETCGKFDLQCIVEGGGKTGQAGAIRHGLARALNQFNPDLYRPPLKRLGYLTRDARMVERKKTGLVKARKAPQWVRR